MQLGSRIGVLLIQRQSDGITETAQLGKALFQLAVEVAQARAFGKRHHFMVAAGNGYADPPTNGAHAVVSCPILLSLATMSENPAVLIRMMIEAVPAGRGRAHPTDIFR